MSSRKTRRGILAGLQWILSLALSLSMQELAAAEVRIHVIETDPASPSTLGHWEQFHLHLGYETDRNIRIYVDAFTGNTPVPSINGGSPLYEPGRGEAHVWVAHTQPVRVDKLVVRAEDRGTRVAQIDIPVELTWTGIKQPATRQPAAWVERFRAENVRRQRAEYVAYMNRPVPWWEHALFFAMAWAGPGYVILQIALLRRYHGRWRRAAAVPVVPMIGVLMYTVYAFQAGSNVFPLVMIFVSPFALLYLLGLIAIHRVTQGTS
ncbi:MAG TPA: hypothetical protein VJ746_15785 [Nitrospira sp.]|nr:hypothetical protein [Nitrospira sp.]